MALASEAAALGRSIPLQCCYRLGRGAAAVFVGGIGHQRATAAAEALIADGATALASFGTAGALVPALGSGSLLLPAQVSDESRTFAADPDWRARLQRVLGREAEARALLSRKQPLCSPRDKAATAQRSGAVAVDMESAAVAAVAAAHGLPFLAVRVVVDELEHAVPQAVSAGIDPWGRARPLALAGALLREPAAIAGLVRLGRAMNRAQQSLREVVAVAGPALAA